LAASGHVSVGAALEKKGRLDEAIKEYRTAIDLDSKKANTHFNLGHALWENKEPEKAIASSPWHLSY
jgi:Tfp pilus assembly protein PilF